MFGVEFGKETFVSAFYLVSGRVIKIISSESLDQHLFSPPEPPGLRHPPWICSGRVQIREGTTLGLPEGPGESLFLQVMAFSGDGKMLAWSNMVSVQVNYR